MYLGGGLMTTTLAGTATATLKSEDAVETLEQKAVKLIVKECADIDCTEKDAEQAYAWINQLVEEAREEGYAFVYPNEDELNSRSYEIFDLIMSHGEHSTPGSAHAAVETALLDRTQGEAFLRHDQLERGGHLYCTVQVIVEIVRI